jgi:hypothetical protein
VGGKKGNDKMVNYKFDVLIQNDEVNVDISPDEIKTAIHEMLQDMGIQNSDVLVEEK